MSDKYINNFIRDDSSVAPEYITALKLNDKEQNPKISKLEKPHYKEHSIVKMHMNKPTYKLHELKHVANYRKFNLDKFKEIHNIYNPQNELRGLPDIKIKPEEQTIFEELGTKGMTDKDIAQSNLLKEYGTLDTFGLHTEANINNSSLDDARAKFMTMYELEKKKPMQIMKGIKKGQSTLQPISDDVKKPSKITVKPVVAPELPNYIPDTNIEENGNKKKRLQRKLNNELNNELPNYIPDTNIEENGNKKTKLQRKLNNELPDYIEETNTTNELKKANKDKRKQVFQKAKETIASSKIANMIKQQLNKPKKGNVETIVSNLEKKINSPKSLQIPQIKTEEEEEEELTKGIDFSKLNKYHKGKINSILLKKGLKI
jgi:hypothetical protein